MGSVEYLEGEVDVYRNGKYVPYNSVTIGMDIERFDLMETYTGGYAEIGLFSAVAENTMVKVTENTAFYFDFEAGYEKNRASFQLLAGSLSLKVQKLAGRGEVIVNTQNAAMGVRGTEFRVITAPDGSVLVTCTEGKVSCKNKRGDERIAQPRTAVEQQRDESMRPLSVETSDVEAFERNWLDQKIEYFLANSLGSLKKYADNYIDYKEKFNQAYNSLMEHNEVFQRWENQKGGGGTMGSAVKDKIAVSTAVFRMRSIIFLFEHVFYRVWGITDLYDAKKLQRGMLWSGYSTDDFFRDFKKDQKNLAWKMAQVRHVFDIYSQMNWDISPEGELSPGSDPLMDDIFSGDNPIDNDDFFNDF